MIVHYKREHEEFGHEETVICAGKRLKRAWVFFAIVTVADVAVIAGAFVTALDVKALSVRHVARVLAFSAFVRV